MCGIVGICNFKKPIENIDVPLKQALKYLNRRGPNIQKSIIDKHVALGHARLSIIDLSIEASQPFYSFDNQYIIVFNGEIYNFHDLRKRLIESGYSFRTQSDTEVLLNSYIHWKESCLDYLDGDFAFAIYDKKQEHLFIARDRFGVKPLVYSFYNDNFIFSSEIKGILPFFSHKPDLSKEALELYLYLNYIPAPFTIYQNIKKLLPGHYIIVNQKGIEIKQYYSLPTKPKTEIQEKNKIFSTFRDLIYQSVKSRLISDVPIGSFLSGGIDSSIITAIAKDIKNDIEAFTIQFIDNKFIDESEDASLTAKYLGVKHHIIPVSQKNIIDNLYQSLDYLDEPFADSSSIAVSVLTQETHKHITVALSGDGSDEVFGGYYKHKAHQFLFKHHYLSKLLLPLFSPITKILPGSRKNIIFNKIRQIQKLSDVASLSSDIRYWRLASFQNEKLINSIYLSSKIINEQWISTFLPTKAQNINEVLYNDTFLVLPNDMLFKTDSMSMLNSLEVRVPILNHHILDFVFPLPEYFKINGKQQKYLLRQTFKSMLPEKILRKPKHGFEIPLEQWLKNDLQHLINDYLSDKNIKKTALFNFDNIQALINKLHSLNPSDSATHLWNLIVFQYWYLKKYF